MIELVIPQSRICASCCPVTTMITGWRVEMFLGATVYEQVFPNPVTADTKIIWKQKASSGGQLGPGFYRIVVTTTDRGEVQAYIKLVDKADCRSLLCNKPARPCGVPVCDAHLKLSALPVCGPCCDPCCDPCCLYPFYIIRGGR